MKKILCLILFLAMVISAGCGKSEKVLNFGTGGSGGTYFAYGSALADILQHYNFDIKETAGSAANLRLLRDGFLDLAIVQSDTLSDAVNGTGIFTAAGAAQGYAAVAGLYTESCQIVVAKNSDIKSVYDLVDRKVSVGEKESGVIQNAQEILLAHGLTIEMLEPSYLSFSDSAAALERGEIEAFFTTSGAPTKAIAELSKRKEIRLIPISAEVTRNIMKMFSGYTPCVIPAGTYSGQNEDVATLGVKAVLVARADVEENKISYITEKLFSNAEKISATANIPNELNLNYAVKDIPCAFHSGAAKFYKSQGVDVEIYSGESSTTIKVGQD